MSEHYHRAKITPAISSFTNSRLLRRLFAFKTITKGLNKHILELPHGVAQCFRFLNVRLVKKSYLFRILLLKIEIFNCTASFRHRCELKHECVLWIFTE